MGDFCLEVLLSGRDLVGRGRQVKSSSHLGELAKEKKENSRSAVSRSFSSFHTVSRAVAS